MEQQPLYNALNFNMSSGFSGSDFQNTTVLAAQVSSMLCPSENQPSPSFGPGTRKSYMANTGGPAAIMAWSGIFVPLKDNPPLGGYAGCYVNSNSGRTFGIAGVTDGTSNTGLFSESLLGAGPGAGSVTRNSTKRPSTYEFKANVTTGSDNGAAGGTAAMNAVNACRSLPGNTPAFGTLQPPNGNIWIAGNPGSCLLWDTYNHYLPPNSAGCITNDDPNTGGYGYYTSPVPPSSNHPGGVNVGFTDGSVKFIKDTVAVTTWWALGTRNGGEVVSADAY
jgi:prepilin-type processing-associated H-X9-DG protein